MWRLKVINGCSNNDDVLLPLVPQTSLLLPFYSQWRDEDEDRHKTAERIEAERKAEEEKRLRAYKKRNKKRRKEMMMIASSGTLTSSSSSPSSRYRIAVKDWLQKIPHVAFGRHTQLPAACRLRHVCVSRLHCRVVYVSDAATHKIILSIYPPPKKRLVNDTHEKTMSNNNNNNNNNRGSTKHMKKNGKDENEIEMDHDDPSVFHGPHYRLLNCGSNPLYINDTPLPWGESRCLRENDVVAFLENPFDEEGGVLQPLRPEDILPKNENDNDSEKSVSVTLNGERNKKEEEKEEESTLLSSSSPSSTTRVLFNSMNHDNPTSTNGNMETISTTKPSELASQQQVKEEEKQGNVFPVFVEVNGKRIARYRPLHVPPALLKPHKTNTTNTNIIIGTGSTPLKQQISLLVGHNRLVGGDITIEEENEEGYRRNGMSPAVHGETLTPSPQLSLYHSPQQQRREKEEQNNHNKNKNRKKKEEEESVDNDHNNYIDVVGEVVSPLQLRVVPSLQRSVGLSATPDGNRYHNNHNNNNNNHHHHHHNHNHNSNGAVCEEPSFSVVSARLPVYVFARRSPSPVEFTRQAHTIGRLNPRKEGKEEKVDKKRNHSEEMTEWVQEDGKKVKTTTTTTKKKKKKLTSSVGTVAPNGGRKRGRPLSGKRRS